MMEDTEIDDLHGPEAWNPTAGGIGYLIIVTVPWQPNTSMKFMLSKEDIAKIDVREDAGEHYIVTVERLTPKSKRRKMLAPRDPDDEIIPF